MQKNKTAFTLIELAIVLVIIGLLVGGILAGQELIKQFKINKVIKEFNTYLQAANTFYGKYGQLPGDFTKANKQLNSSAVNSNGNKLIGDSGISGGNYNEVVTAWNHLSLAGILPGFENAVGTPNISIADSWLINNVIPESQSFSGAGYKFSGYIHSGQRICNNNGIMLVRIINLVLVQFGILTESMLYLYITPLKLTGKWMTELLIRVN